MDEKKAKFQLISAHSAVIFTANFLQSRVVINDIGGQLAKLYDALGVKKAEEFEQRMDELASAGDERRGRKIAELREAFREWETLLARLDVELERVAGPNIQTELGETGREIQLVSSNKMFKGGSLLSYVQSSSYPLMFLEVVASFAVQECYEHVKRMFDSLAEFHKLGCDILLLARRPAAGGSGFLKLIGMPFRQMLNDSESMRQILQHRQSALSMAGIRALHIYTEFLCNDYTLELANNNNNNSNSTNSNNNKQSPANAAGETPTAEKKAIGEHSGCVLINRHGHILYSYLCTDSSDWPDVEVLLEQVRVNFNRRPSVVQRSENALLDDAPAAGAVLTGNSATGEKANGTAEVPPMAPSSTEGGEVAVHKRKCCRVM
ncbi:hypothetical protein niasHT_015412 [Heterodera trifolii]|uniref:Uncharacterized protein n=1 Tax=Heterodera trifolii TaxID=157864 RepID=A0ABD2L0Y7_9BILA